MKRVLEFISENAYAFMLAGMIIGISGLVLLMRFNRTGGPREIAIGIGIAGIVAYVLARVALIYKGKHPKKKNNANEL